MANSIRLKRRALRTPSGARVLLTKALSLGKRTSSGIEDGTITAEEHEAAQFAAKVGVAQVRGSEAELQKAKLEVDLGAVLVQDAEVKEERARVALEKTQLRAPFAGVVSFCDVQEGERVRVGDHVYTVEESTKL